MALIFRGCSRCSICGEVIGHHDEIVATTHFIADKADPLWRFSDSGMHRACYQSWPHRDEFRARYEAVMGDRPQWSGRAESGSVFSSEDS
ncbi:hypothetical protein PX52LOC_03391 [Limnoglobus roseus]|uniref:Uncharacterized protein n=1 Tax=Limnoglobus roseus TaxID=2598579 RepID=A0A5C1AE13_9BACT|nr:hypothetical protein PX52LOC_03391 [Limnoglobus roseus]